MYILEKLEFQGTEQCPQNKWKQVVMCRTQAPLDHILAKQRCPQEWRITKTAFDGLTNTNKQRYAA
jgi:hypothetical protein